MGRCARCVLLVFTLTKDNVQAFISCTKVGDPARSEEFNDKTTRPTCCGSRRYPCGDKHQQAEVPLHPKLWTCESITTLWVADVERAENPGCDVRGDPQTLLLSSSSSSQTRIVVRRILSTFRTAYLAIYSELDSDNESHFSP